MRKLARLLPYLAVLLIPLIALAVLLRAGSLAEHLRRAVETELSRQLGREVTIARASFTLSGRVMLQGVVIENPDRSPLLAAPEISARVGREGSWLPLFSGLSDVRELKLVRPALSLTRDANGNLSIADLLARQAEEPSPFRGTVVVEGGRIEFRDGTRGGLSTVIESADFKLWRPNSELTAFSLKAAGSDGAFAGINLQGENDSAAQRTRISGTIEGLDIPYAIQRLPALSVLDIPTGRADIKGDLSLGGNHPGRRFTCDLAADLTETTLSFPWLRRPIEKVQGRVHLLDNDLRLEDLSGTLAESPISASGTISNLQAPHFDLDVSVSGIRYPQVRALLPSIVLPAGLALPSPLRIRAHVAGPASDINVTGEGTVRVVKFRAIPWNDLVGKFEYSHGRLKLSGLHAHGSPRRAAGDLVIDWRSGRRTLHGNLELTDVPLSMVAQMAGLDGAGWTGTASLKIQTISNGQQLLSGEFIARQVVVRGLPLGTLAGEFELAGDRITIRRGAIEGPIGAGSASGALSLAGPFEVQARFSSLDLSAVGTAIGRPELTGAFPAELEASGNSRTLTGSARLRLGPGDALGRSFHHLQAAVAASPLSVQISDLLLLMGQGEYRGESLALTNWLAGWERARMQGKLQVTGAAIADWLPPDYAARAPEGRVGGEIALSGSLSDPQLKLNLALESLTLAGQRVTGGRLALTYQGGRLAIEEMFLDDGASHLEVAGSYDPQAGLALSLCADPLDLSWLAPEARSRYGLTLSGALRATAQVTGPLARPLIDFSCQSDGLRANGEDIAELAFNGRISDGSLYLDSGLVRLAGGSASLAGSVNFQARSTDLSIDLADLSLGRLYTAAYLSVWRLAQSGNRSPYLVAYAKIPHPLTGSLTADLRVESSFRRPRIRAHNLAFAGLGYAGRNIGRIQGDADLSLQLDGLSFPVREAEVNLVASDEMGDARISGGLTPEGEVSLVVDSLGSLDLNLLGPWLRYPLDLSGQATINFDISGPIEKPVLRGDIWVDRLQIGPFVAEQAMASPISLKEGVLEVEEIRFTNPPQAGSPPTEAVGSISFPLFPANGSPREPRITAPQAQLHVKNGSLALLPGMRPALFDADVYLDGSRILLTADRSPAGPGAPPGIRGKMGSGAFSISGEIELRRPAPADWRQHRFDVTLDLQAAEIVIPGIAGAKLDGALWLTNTQPRAEKRTDPAAPTMSGPVISAIADGARGDLQTSFLALLKTREGRPLVLSEPTLSVAKLGSLAKPGRAFAGPQADVTVRIGSPMLPAADRPEAADAPTTAVVDLGILKVSGPAAGRLAIGGDLSADGYTLAGTVKFRDGQAAFPNAVLTLRHAAVEIRRDKGRLPEVRISDAEAAGRVGEYNITLRPAGRIYPIEEKESAERLTPLPLNAATIPYLDPAIAVALLWGPVVTPSRGGGGTGEITGVMLPTLGGSGAPELSLDVAVQGPVQMRLGERIFSRVLITYASPISGPRGARSLGITYEVIPPLMSVGWSVDELDRTRWELRAFRSF